MSVPNYGMQRQESCGFVFQSHLAHLAKKSWENIHSGNCTKNYMQKKTAACNRCKWGAGMYVIIIIPISLWRMEEIKISRCTSGSRIAAWQEAVKSLRSI